MKIAVTASTPQLDGLVDPRFGRCPYYLFVDPETMVFEAVENPHVGASSGAGIQAAQFVAGKNVEAVLTGSCGPNAFQVLRSAGVKVVIGVGGNISEAVQKYASGGAFREADGPDVPAHSGMGMGAGRGGGRMAGARNRAGFAMEASPGQPAQDPAPGRMSPEAELDALKRQAQDLRRHMDRVSERIVNLEKQIK